MGSVLQDCPSPHVRLQLKVQVVTWASDLLAYRLEVPMIFSDLNNLLEPPAELRAIVYSIDYRFIILIKEHISGTAR